MFEATRRTQIDRYLSWTNFLRVETIPTVICLGLRGSGSLHSIPQVLSCKRERERRGVRLRQQTHRTESMDPELQDTKRKRTEPLKTQRTDFPALQVQDEMQIFNICILPRLDTFLQGHTPGIQSGTLGRKLAQRLHHLHVLPFLTSCCSFA